MKSSNSFTNTERIVRNIYSPKNINPNSNTLKANFVGFAFNPDTQKHELSCNRFEIDSVEDCKIRGEIFAQKDPYYGIACISVRLIQSFQGLEIRFTPKLHTDPPNPTHCDIYDTTIPHPTQIGEANTAEINYRRTEFLNLWKPYKYVEALTKEAILPIELN